MVVIKYLLMFHRQNKKTVKTVEVPRESHLSDYQCKLKNNNTATAIIHKGAEHKAIIL